MNANILTVLLVIGVFAVPAAVPASQPTDVRLTELNAAPITLAPETVRFASLIADPKTNGELSISYIQGYANLGWINEDPFVN
jgi:hypothetical protein